MSEKTTAEKIIEALGKAKKGLTDQELSNIIKPNSHAAMVTSRSVLCNQGIVEWNGEKRYLEEGGPPRKVFVLTGKPMDERPPRKAAKRRQPKKTRKATRSEFMGISERLSIAARAVAVLEQTLDTLIEWTVQDNEEVAPRDLIEAAFENEDLVQRIAEEVGRDVSHYLEIYR